MPEEDSKAGANKHELQAIHDEAVSVRGGPPGVGIFHIVLGLALLSHFLWFEVNYLMATAGVISLAGGAVALFLHDTSLRKSLKLIEIDATGVSGATFEGEKFSFPWDEIIGVVFNKECVTIVANGKSVEVWKKRFPLFGEICRALRGKGF